MTEQEIIVQQKEEIELLNNRLNTDSQDFTIQCLREIEKLLRDQLSATQAREVQQKEEITTMRLERGNKVALLLLDIADEQLKQQALQSELSALQAREVMLVEALEGVRSDLEISCSSADAKRNEIIRNYITEELSLSNSTEHTERFMAEVKAKTLESIPYRVFKDGDSWCAAGCGFINLQESKAGFGDSPLVALGELIVLEGEN